MKDRSPWRWGLALLMGVGTFLIGAFLFMRFRGQEPLILAPRVKDLGVITAYTRAQGTFKVINSGSVPLTISDIKADCSCLALQGIGAVVPSGGEHEIPLEINAGGGLGKMRWRIIVYARGRKQYSQSLEVIARIVADCYFSHSEINFGRLHHDDKRSIAFWCWPSAGYGGIRPQARTSDSAFLVKPLETSKESDKGWGWEVSFKGCDTTGLVKSMLQMEIGLSSRTVYIPIMAHIVGDIRVQPAAFLFGVVDEGGRYSVSLNAMIETGAKGRLQASVNSPSLSAKVAQLDNAHFRIECSMVANRSLYEKPQFVRIYSDSGFPKEILVPVVFVMKPSSSAQAKTMQ